MTLFFIFNPKQFLLPTSAGGEDGDPYRKRRFLDSPAEIRAVEKAIEDILPIELEEALPIANPDVQKDIAEYLVLTRKLEELDKKTAEEEKRKTELKALEQELDRIEKAIEAERQVEEQKRIEKERKIIAKRILEMQEEEEAIIMLLFN